MRIFTIGSANIDKRGSRKKQTKRKRNKQTFKNCSGFLFLVDFHIIFSAILLKNGERESPWKGFNRDGGVYLKLWNINHNLVAYLPNFASSSISEGDRLALRHMAAMTPMCTVMQQRRSTMKSSKRTPPTAMPTMAAEESTWRSATWMTSIPIREREKERDRHGGRESEERARFRNIGRAVSGLLVCAWGREKEREWCGVCVRGKAID